MADRSAFRRDAKRKISKDIVIEDGKMYIPRLQDVTEIIDENARLEEAHSLPGAERRLAARIPLVVWQTLCDQGIAQDDEALARWLDDPDNRAHRVWKGRLSKR